MRGLAAELRLAGIDICHVDLNRTGEWQRVSTEDKPNRRNGHVKVFDTRPLAVWYQNMATNTSGYYREQGSPFHAFRSLLRAAPPPVQRQDGWGTAAKIAKRNWEQAHCAADHPYLKRKQIQPHGIRQLGTSLLIPMVDENRLMWSTQTIHGDGSKLYLKGGRKRGCYYPIGGEPDEFLFLVEGFATGASVAQCCGVSVAVCFDAGNLKPVAKVLSLKFPKAELIFAADNDIETPGNPGVAKAEEAASLYGGRVLIPEFDEPGYTDWNDVHVHFGAEKVRDLIVGLL